MNTHVTEADKALFESLLAGRDDVGLFSCLLDGTPAVAICAAGLDEATGEHVLEPLLVAVTPGMKLTDHEGNPP